MNWFKPKPQSVTPEISISIEDKAVETRRGMPVYEELTGEKLEQRDIFVTCDGEQRRVKIDVLRNQFRRGIVPGDLLALVTTGSDDKMWYCGEGTVAEVVAAWEAAPLQSYELQDVKRMIREFGLPEYQVASKAEYSDLRRLYERCDKYYRYVGWHDKEFKRLTKSGTKELVFTLDAEDPTWDASEGEERFVAEVRKRLPHLVWNVREQRGRVEHVKEVELRRKERQYLNDTRNNLTNFPHKDLEITVKDGAAIKIREIKRKLNDGSMSPETLVRYRSENDWVELGEFLDEWIKKRATIKQLDYLAVLQKQHGINAEIAVDCLRKEISERISALVATPEGTHLGS
jgi:hypothetical protein